MMADKQELENDFSDDDFWQQDEGVEKKRLPRWAIVCLVLVFALGIIVIASMGNEEELALNVVSVARGRVVEVYSANGTIESERMQVFHSLVSAPINALNVQVGDTVRAGDLILTYDLENLELVYQQTALQLEATRHGNEATVQMSENDQNRQARDLQQQNEREANLRSEIAAIDNEIARLRAAEEAQARAINVQIDGIQAQRLANRGEYGRLFAERSNLVLSLQGVHLTLEEREAILTEIAELDDDMVILDDALRELDVELEAARMASLSISTDERMDAQQERANLNFMLGNMETTPAFPTPNPELTSGQLQSMQASEELLALSKASAQELLERAEEGIRAEFDGIISSLLIREGSAAMQGGALFTLVSIEDIIVRLEIPANDFDRVVLGNEALIQLGNREYQGIVERINPVATANVLGQMMIEVIVSIEEPDDVFVGVPTRVDLTVARRDDVLYLPPEVVNMAASGHFVHVLVDGVVERRIVEVGIASNHQIEITSGVDDGELIIAEVAAGELEGVQATPIFRE